MGECASRFVSIGIEVVQIPKWPSWRLLQKSCSAKCSAKKLGKKKLHLFAVSASSIHIPAVNIRFFELQQFSLRSRLKPSQACLKHECKWLVDCVYAKVHTGSSQHIKSPFHLCIAVCMFEITILQNDQMLTSEVSIKFPSFITSKTPLESFCIFVN